MRQSHCVSRPHAQLAAARQIVEGARDDPQTHGIQLLQKRCDVPGQRAVDEGLQKNGLGAVLALVHCDQLAEHRVGALAAGSPALDAGLLAGAQAVEHYEISRYGTLRTWANELGYKDAVKLLDATLKEEKATDSALSQLAESEVNQHAETAQAA